MTNIFISRPTIISTKYESPYSDFEEFLTKKGIKSRRLGRGDYSRKAPLVAVMELIEDCKGAIVLGYPQYEIHTTSKKADDVLDESCLLFPTPWNQIEAVLAYKKKIPVLVIAQNRVGGGIFDDGVTGEFVLRADLSKPNWYKEDEFSGIFNEWYKEVNA